MTLELAGQGRRLRRLSGDVCKPVRSRSRLRPVGPHQARQAAGDVARLPEAQRRAGVGDGRQDLGPVAHDRGITQQPGHVLVPEAGHHLRVETGEGVTEGRPLAQDRGPGQARLEGLQAQPLEDSPLVAHRHAPLGVVVLAQQRVGGRPSRPGQTVIPHHQVRVVGLSHEYLLVGDVSGAPVWCRLPVGPSQR